jgi:hypothetical protein
MIDGEAVETQTVDGEQGNDGQRVDEQIEKRGCAREDVSAGCPEEDGSGDVEEVQCDDMRGKTPGPGSRVCGVDDGLEEDEEEPYKPQIHRLAGMTPPEEIKDAEQQGHCGEVG